MWERTRTPQACRGADVKLESIRAGGSEEGAGAEGHGRGECHSFCGWGGVQFPNNTAMPAESET